LLQTIDRGIKILPASRLGLEIMLYPIYVHLGDETHAHSVTIPDFPGCFSAADGWDDLNQNVQQALELYCEGEDMNLPKPSDIGQLNLLPEYQDGIWMMLDIDISRLSRKAKRINITVPEADLAIIDRAAAHAKMTRSGFMTQAALEKAG
jgi:predicted RNase H-like HicB family nuclease